MSRWIFALIAIAAMAAFSRAQQKTVHWGDWELTFDAKTGDWLALRWQGQTVVQVPSSGNVASIDIAVGEKEAKRRWLIERNLTKSRLTNWDFDTKTITLTRQISIEGEQWQLQEFIQFCAFGNPNRIARYLKLTWLGNQPVKFYRARFLLPLPKNGIYLCPTKDPFDPNRSGDFALRPSGWWTSASWGVGQLLVQQSENRTLLFINDARRDPAGINLWATDDAIFVAHEFQAMGWAEPKTTQTIGTAFVEVVPANLPTALRSAFWRFYEDAGIKVPSDRPEWVHKVALYSFHPGGTIGSDFKDLGGFEMARRYLLPIVHQLGFGAIWLLPIEDVSVYHPRDYYRFQAGLGTAEEYRNLVYEAHRLGMKVWQDIVPHGGRPEFGKFRGNKPWWLVFDEDGNALEYWCFDFREPEWQHCIGEVAEHYVRNFGIDGFRVDAVGGSRIMNWRRKGFPPAEKVPANIAADWWQNELAKVGGQVPPLPYERGSLTLREGGLQMLGVIRQATRKHNFEGAILGEVGIAPYMQEADVIYDFALCHSHLPRLRDFSPAEFVWALQRYFEEQRFAEPKGTIRLRYAESHDSLRIQGWVGISAMRAIMALTFWIDGMPMLYHEAEVGHGVFIQRALALRKALPELQTGEAFYTDAAHAMPLVKTEPEGIFTCLRTIDFERASIPVINFNPKAVNAVIQLPLTANGTRPQNRQPLAPSSKIPALHLDKSKRYALWEMMSGTKVAEGSPKEIATVKLVLQPYQAALLCLRPTDEQLKLPLTEITQTQTTSSPRPAAVKQTAEGWEIVTSHYRLLIDNKTGLIRSFSAAKGRVSHELHSWRHSAGADNSPPVNVPSKSPLKASGLAASVNPVLVSGCDLILSEQVSLAKVLGKVQTEPKTGVVTLPLQLLLSDGSQVQLTYRCLPTEVQFRATLNTKVKTSRAGLLFTIADAYRWQINTIEGVLDDWFFVRHMSGRRGTHRIYWRPQGTEIVWQSEVIPLHHENAWLRFWRKDGSGVQLAFENPLQMGVDNVALLDKVWDEGKPKVGAFVAIMWHEGQTFVPPNNLPRSFTLRISANPQPPLANAQSQLPSAKSPVDNPKPPALKLSHTSTCWVIENEHYRILLRRTGGVIRAIWAKQPNERLIFSDSDIYADKGFRNVLRQVQYAGARDDVETGVRVWCEETTLRLRFFGLLRAGNERFRMLQPPIWFVQDYAFNSSPNFALRFAIMSEGNVQVPPAFLAWAVLVPDAQRFAYLRTGMKIGEWFCDEKQRTGEVSKVGHTFSPEEVIFSDAKGQTLAKFENFQFEPYFPRNMFMHGKRFFIAWLDGDESIAVRRWHECKMQVTIGSALTKPMNVKFDRLAAENEFGVVDPSFESEGSEVFALAQGRWLQFGAPKLTRWSIPTGGSITSETAKTGKRCAKVVNTTGDYTLFVQNLSLHQFPPNNKVRLSAWLKGENIKRGDQSWKAASLDLSVQRKDGRWEHKPVAFLEGTFDWLKVEGVVEIPSDAAALMVRVGLNGATGILWIDDVQVEVAK